MLHHLHTTEPAPDTKGRTIRWAGFYDFTVSLLTFGQAPALRAQTARQAQIKAGDRVLDVGCGTGDLTLVAKQRAGPTGQVFGLDPAPEMIEVARQKATRRSVEIDFRVGVIEALPFPDDYFDVVLSSLMMHHLPDDLQSQGLAEIYRVLRSPDPASGKPGGRLLVLDFKRPTSRASRAFLLMHWGLKYGIQDLPTKLQAAGFTSITTRDASPGMLGFAEALK